MDTGSAETLVPPSPSPAVLMAPWWADLIEGWPVGQGRVRSLGPCCPRALLRVLCVRILWANTFQILLLLSFPNSCDVYPESTVHGALGEY